MSKALLYTANTSGDSVAVNTPIPVGAVIRRYGCVIRANTASISLLEAGYYDVTVGATFTVATAGNVTLSLVQDGNTISSATETFSTPSTEYRSLNIPSVIRVYCHAGTSTLTVMATGTAPNVENLNITVEKV